MTNVLQLFVFGMVKMEKKAFYRTHDQSLLKLHRTGKWPTVVTDSDGSMMGAEGICPVSRPLNRFVDALANFGKMLGLYANYS